MGCPHSVILIFFISSHSCHKVGARRFGLILKRSFKTTDFAKFNNLNGLRVVYLAALLLACL
jgi:hypothetical protein